MHPDMSLNDVVNRREGMYYTPKELTVIIDPTAGSGVFLKVSFDLLVNPPFIARPSLLSRFQRWLARVADWILP